MKVNILFEFKKGPWGGGNQFLKALKQELEKQDRYCSDPAKAEVIIFNSHHKIKEVIKLKQKYESKIFIHRIDGPVYKIRGRDKEVDKQIYNINYLIANGTIFQSEWSKKQNIKLGFKVNNFNKIIYNSCDNRIFNRKNKKIFNPNKKIKIVASSWSSNFRKGFDYYLYLDRHLDFLKYDMTFVGNLPVKFQNIKIKKSVNSKKLANIFKKHDVFITASRNDPCSNVLIEAMSCGLPVIALNSGGHSEIIKKGGELFNKKEEMARKIETICQNYNKYQKEINIQNILNVSRDYYSFAKKVYEQFIK